MDFSEITNVEDIEARIAEAREAAAPLVERARGGETLPAEERSQLAEHAATIDSGTARITEINQQAEADAAEQAELLDRFAEPEASEADPEPEPEADPEPEAPAEDTPAEPESPAEPVAEEAPMPDSLAASGATAPVRRRPTPRPEVPAAAQVDPYATEVAITASSAVGSIGIHAELTMDTLGEMFATVAERMPAPNGDGRTEDLRMAPLAQITVKRPEEFQLTNNEALNNERIKHVLDQNRLSGDDGEQGLVAAGGWCAPSEVLYNIPVIGESLDGMLSIPEMSAARGGIRSTTGPDFATLFAAIGFHQTETQAIAGTTKTCYEVPCPSFTETRLDVEGVCLKVPILTLAGYPEMVQRIMSGALVVHAHRINAWRLASIATASTAVTITAGVGSTFEDTLGALELRAEYIRQAYRMPFDATLEVVMDHFARAYLRRDLALRSGLDPRNPVTDQALDAHFRSRNLAVQWVYDWNTMANPTGGTGGISSQTTLKALIYPAGTWLGLTKDVINLSSVYDAASLATNVYTGLFSEEGVGVRMMSGVSELVTVPICSKGQTGANALTCS